MRRRIILSVMVLAAASSWAAAGLPASDQDMENEFFSKARLIMSKEETDIYRHLADDAARLEFIREFWSKRDPTPDTPENEFKMEFERRIAYANRWFKENRALGQGWNSDRGRILLQLGEPDRRELVEMTNIPGARGVEQWQYFDFNLVLQFVDRNGFGEYRLNSWPAGLLTAMDLARSTLSLTDRGRIKNAIRFEASYRQGVLKLEIPAKRIAFQEQNGRMTAGFEVTCYVYRNFLKTDTVRFSKRIDGEPTEFLKRKSISLEFPLPLPLKGKYHLDVVLGEPFTQTRFRNFCRFSQ